MHRNKIAGMEFKIAGRKECSDHSFSNLTRNNFILYFSTQKSNELEWLGKIIPCEW